MLKSNIDVFFVTSFLCSLKFLLFYRIEYPKRCQKKKQFYGGGGGQGVRTPPPLLPSKSNVASL